MDMVFRDDECRVRTNHPSASFPAPLRRAGPQACFAPANFTTLKHMALNLTRQAPGKDSIRLKRKVAAWDDDFLASLIAA